MQPTIALLWLFFAVFPSLSGQARAEYGDRACHRAYQLLVDYHDFVSYVCSRNELAKTAAQQWDMTMLMNAASSGIVSMPLVPHLGQHFLEVAEEARATGNEELAVHFIELALEAFDGAFGQDFDSDPDLSDISEAHEEFFNVAC